MKLLAVKTSHGLIPYSEDDEEKFGRIPKGKCVEISISSARNPGQHRKYFKLIDVAWNYQPESVREFYKNKEVFRKSLELCAGHCELVWDFKFERFVEIPKSISFNSMSQEEFAELYEKVMSIIVSKFLVHLDDRDRNNFFEILDNEI